MHELDVTQTIVDALLAEMEVQQIDAIISARLRVGKLTTFVPDSIKFYYSSIIVGTKLEGSELDIEEVAVEGKCNGCSESFNPYEPIFICPKCGSTDIDIVAGQEMEVVSIEIEDV